MVSVCILLANEEIKLFYDYYLFILIMQLIT